MSMVTVRVRNCPAHIRGYLRRFFFEPSTGVFVGKASKKVAEQCWNRISQDESELFAIMVRSTNQNEQGFVFYSTENDVVHNDEDLQTQHKRVQFESDGIVLFGHEFLVSNAEDLREDHSDII